MIEELTRTLDYRRATYPPQSVIEFEALCGLVRELRPAAILEVGSRHGRSILRLAEAAMPSLERVICIDLPGKAWGHDSSERELAETLYQLERRRIACSLLDVDSHGQHAKHFAVKHAEFFDLIFLDGDHSFEGISQDFERFWPCLRSEGIMALHDINGDPDQVSKGLRMGVPRFWAQLKASNQHHCREIIDPEKRFGIGIVWKP